LVRNTNTRIALLIVKLDPPEEGLPARLRQLIEKDYFISQHATPLWNFTLLHPRCEGKLERIWRERIGNSTFEFLAWRV
jgi:hypothetical protein